MRAVAVCLVPFPALLLALQQAGSLLEDLVLEGAHNTDEVLHMFQIHLCSVTNAHTVNNVFLRQTNLCNVVHAHTVNNVSLRQTKTEEQHCRQQKCRQRMLTNQSP